MKKISFTVFLIAIMAIGTTSIASSNIPLIGSKAPSFKAKSTEGNIKFPQDFGKSWKILFSHPQDFTPVCSSELLEMANLKNDFEKLDVKVAVISTDDVEQHLLWKEYLESVDYKNRGLLKIDFPIIEDTEASVSKTYGMLHQPVSSNKDIRGVFIIDGNNIIRSINFYPMEIGRNMEEIVRIVEALQTSDDNQVLTPANWNEGDDVMVPHFPYTKKELEENPELEDQYYNVGNRLWFKKTTSLVSK